jgi:hypothetical protein
MSHFFKVFILVVILLSSGCGGMSLKKSLPANFKSHGYQVSNKSEGHPVRSGDDSMRFEVRSGDCSWSSGWNDCERDRERHELLSVNTFLSGEDWFHWSIYIPEDYKIIYPVKVALAQFHQQDSHPVLMFQNGSGGYTVDNQVIGSTLETKKVLTDEEMRGRWSDVLVHVKWTSEQNGFFRVYVNGKTVPGYVWVGPTKEKGRRVYFKFGIYRSFLSRGIGGPAPTQVVYYDDLARGNTCDEVTKYFNCSAIVEGQSDLPTTSDLSICDGKLCPPTYDRTILGLQARFDCWINHERSLDAKSLPTQFDLDTIIGNITGNKFYLSKNRILLSGVPSKVMAEHSKDIVRLINYTFSNERFCEKTKRTGTF